MDLFGSHYKYVRRTVRKTVVVVVTTRVTTVLPQTLLICPRGGPYHKRRGPGRPPGRWNTLPIDGGPLPPAQGRFAYSKGPGN